MKDSDIIYQPEQVKSLVVVGKGRNESVGSYLAGMLSGYKSLYAFIDKELMVKSQIARDLAVQLQDMKCPMMAIETTEQTKSIDHVLEMCSWLMDKGAGRDAVLVAIGGGITTDMVGFAASIYKRGVRYVNVPTTLLSQIDAGLGGKTGVNFQKYKNMLGTVHQPSVSFLWPAFLTTLPRRDFLSGAAEMLKTFMIEDGANYRKAADLFFDMSSEYSLEVLMNGKDEKKTWDAILKKNMTALGGLIEAAAHVKTGIVSRDPFEKDERRKLNLGHTFAHAIESLAQKDGGERFDGEGVTHGEAVAKGLVLAARLADRYYRKDKNDPTELEAIVSNDLWDGDIPCFCPYTVEEMVDAMKKDKKAEGGRIHFVLPKSIGHVEVVAMTVDELCRLMA